MNYDALVWRRFINHDNVELNYNFVTSTLGNCRDIKTTIASETTLLMTGFGKGAGGYQMRQFYRKYDGFLKILNDTAKHWMARGRLTLCASAKENMRVPPCLLPCRAFVWIGNSSILRHLIGSCHCSVAPHSPLFLLLHLPLPPRGAYRSDWLLQPEEGVSTPARGGSPLLSLRFNGITLPHSYCFPTCSTWLLKRERESTKNRRLF